jgi:hypothetical protein
MLRALLTFVLILNSVALAQSIPRAEVAIDYSHLQLIGGFGTGVDGGTASATFSVNQWLGLAGDFGAYHASPGGGHLNFETYTAGPRFYYRRLLRFTPFVDALLGGSHASGMFPGFSQAENPFAYGFCGGADVGLERRGKFALRTQLEYFGFRAGGITGHTIRVCAGVVYRIGLK